MKKFFLAMALVMTTATLFADHEHPVELQKKYGIFKAEWTPFQLSLFPASQGQLFVDTADVYGIAISVFAMEQKNSVFTVGLTSGQDENTGLLVEVVSLINKNYGLDISALTGFTGRNYGVQIGAINIEAGGYPRKEELKEGATGLQIGIYNIGQGFQIGLLNYNPDAYFLFFPIINFPIP